MRKVCVITGTRAEFGLLQWVMQGIQKSEHLALQIVVTGAHLSPEFGHTYREIEASGFTIDRKVEMLLSSDTPVGISKSMGLGVIGMADALHDLNPDLVLLLGDRYEVFSAAVAALIAHKPVAHLHGGETTEGAFDEALRHAITKMSHLHFVAADEYKQRVIQLGENPANVFQVGGLGIDSILKLKLMERETLEVALDFQFGEKNLLVTFHPETLEHGKAHTQINELLAALDTLTDTRIIFTMPNADTESRKISDAINLYVSGHKNAKVYTSLGQLKYLSVVAQVDAVVGNSSSGIIEVPSLKTATINIGDRQKGRLRARSVIDCEVGKSPILSAISKAYSAEFQLSLEGVKNPYGSGGASTRIVDVLEKHDLNGIVKKTFYDLSLN